ncbi:hypothetical protein BH09ACT5_BH09ACT5_19660 [soil metagenome]
MPGGEFFPPVQYQPWWALLGIAIRLLVIAWWLFIAWSTRKSRVPARDYTGRPATETVGVIRERYLGLIDEAAAAYAKGELQDREAYHRLSMLLRSYVEEREGTRTVTMTLGELRKTRLIALSDAIARLYPGAFSPHHRGTVPRAIDEARALVTSWK